MEHMTEHRPYTATRHDYIPAFGIDALLPFYDLLTRVQESKHMGVAFLLDHIGDDGSVDDATGGKVV